MANEDIMSRILITRQHYQEAEQLCIKIRDNKKNSPKDRLRASQEIIMIDQAILKMIEQVPKLRG